MAAEFSPIDETRTPSGIPAGWCRNDETRSPVWFGSASDVSRRPGYDVEEQRNKINSRRMCGRGGPPAALFAAVFLSLSSRVRSLVIQPASQPARRASRTSSGWRYRRAGGEARGARAEETTNHTAAPPRISNVTLWCTLQVSTSSRRFLRLMAHSGATVAQPCHTCGNRRKLYSIETREHSSN